MSIGFSPDIQKEVFALYGGFYIDQPVGNNAFAYSERTHKSLYVAPLISGNLSDVEAGDQIVFAERRGQDEFLCRGLKKFIHIVSPERDIFIFDNHNHAFFFWCLAVKAGKITPGTPLLHVDQHQDMRQPPQAPDFQSGPGLNLAQAFRYTNFVLHVGNFIVPALDLNIFSNVSMLNKREAFEKTYPPDFVLDIDMDIFAPELDYIDKNLKISTLRSLIRQTTLVTIATSPFFIGQNEAMALLKEVLSDAPGDLC